MKPATIGSHLHKGWIGHSEPKRCTQDDLGHVRRAVKDGMTVLRLIGPWNALAAREWLKLSHLVPSLTLWSVVNVEDHNTYLDELELMPNIILRYCLRIEEAPPRVEGRLYNLLIKNLDVPVKKNHFCPILRGMLKKCEACMLCIDKNWTKPIIFLDD